MTTYDMLRAGIDYAELSHKYGRPYMHVSDWYFYQARLRTPVLRECDRLITTVGLT